MTSTFLRVALCSAALCSAAPALAVTPMGGSVNSGAKVQIGRFIDQAADSDNGAGAPAALGSDVKVALTDSNGIEIRAFSNTTATWASATEGNVKMAWGWHAKNGGFNPTSVSTSVFPGDADWTYAFTTGAEAGTFDATWNTVISGTTSSEGVMNVFGGGSMPKFVTPETFAPDSDMGAFSVGLAPNTAYAFSIYNLGHLSSMEGLKSNATGYFNMNWTITTAAVPEPGSWALMITGFGLMGARIRQRRRVLA